jgi:hypothetical protein
LAPTVGIAATGFGIRAIFINNSIAPALQILTIDRI